MNQRTRELAKNYVKNAVKKMIRQLIKKLIKQLAKIIGKLILKVIGILVATIGLPTLIIILCIVIIGGAILVIAPSFGWFDSDSPITVEEAKKKFNTLIVASSELPEYRPPLKLASSIDAVRILKEDKDPWEIEPKPIVNGLTPELTYVTYKDTYEIKKVIETRVTDYEYPNRDLPECKNVKSEFCDKVVISTEIETETVIETETQEVKFIKSAHAWNTLDKFYYKEMDKKDGFKKLSENSSGDTTTTIYKRKVKEWQLERVNNTPNYEKFDKVIHSLDFKEDDINILVAALIENGVHMDGYMGSFFNVFIENGMGMMVPPEFMEIYIAAQKKYNVDWNYLAAFHFVETKFSTINPMLSPVGAEGPFQFMPCTFVGWSHPTCDGNGKGDIPENVKTDPAAIKRYGGYGIDGNLDGKSDPFNIYDAAFTAANYLNKSGFSTDKRKAIFNYNHADWYVDKIIHFAELFGSSTGSIPEITKGKFMIPSLGPLTSPYGPRWGKMHLGIDIGSNSKVDPVVASADGVVTRSAYSSSYGEVVYIKHNINGQMYTSVYAHMVSGSRRVVTGQNVSKGHVIGIKGTTGDSTGVHLHFEIHTGEFSKNNAVDPIGTGLLKWE
jgi:murein DD-endopeptidase MepM/ murein hydrolase activator NlpD